MAGGGSQFARRRVVRAGEPSLRPVPRLAARARREFPGKTLLDGAIHLPLVLPPVVVGYLLLVLLGRRGVLGAPLHDLFGVTVAFTWQGAAVASAGDGPAADGPRHPPVSRERGPRPGGGRAHPRRGAVRRLPQHHAALILPGILAGTVLSFARSLGEFGAPSPSSPTSPARRAPFPSRSTAIRRFPAARRRQRALPWSRWRSPSRRCSFPNCWRGACARASGADRMLEFAARRRVGGFTLDAEFAVPETGATALFGRSGAGKTTVLDIVAGLRRPDAGRVSVGRAAAARHCRRRRPAGEPAPRGICVPGWTTVPASRCARQSRIRRASQRGAAASGDLRSGRRTAGPRRSAAPPARHPFGRRAPTGGHRPRLAVEPPACC